MPDTPGATAMQMHTTSVAASPLNARATKQSNTCQEAVRLALPHEHLQAVLIQTAEALPLHRSAEPPSAKTMMQATNRTARISSTKSTQTILRASTQDKSSNLSNTSRNSQRFVQLRLRLQLRATLLNRRSSHTYQQSARLWTMLPTSSPLAYVSAIRRTNSSSNAFSTPAALIQ
jgi:hypothetical protein